MPSSGSTSSAGEVRRLLLEDLLARVRVVPRQHDDVLHHGGRHARRTTRSAFGLVRLPAAFAGGVTLTSAQSCVPWYAPSNFAIFGRPVNARATRTAFIVASVPEFVKRTLSQRRNAPRQLAASAISLSVGPGNDSPRSAACCTALMTVRRRVAEDQARVVAVEVEAVVAVRVPDVRALPALDVERIRIEERRRAAVAARHDRHRLLVQRAGARRSCRGTRPALVRRSWSPLHVTARVPSGHGASSRAAARCSLRRRRSARKRQPLPGLHLPEPPMSNEHTVASFV